MEKTNNEANIEGVEKSFSNAPKGYIGISGRFAQINKLITRDLNNNTTTPTFSRYSKDEIATYLENPYTYEKQLKPLYIFMEQAPTLEDSSNILLGFLIYLTSYLRTRLTLRSRMQQHWVETTVRF